MNVQHKATILIGCALCWTFIGSAVLWAAYYTYCRPELMYTRYII